MTTYPMSSVEPVAEDALAIGYKVTRNIAGKLLAKRTRRAVSCLIALVACSAVIADGQNIYSWVGPCLDHDDSGNCIQRGSDGSWADASAWVPDDGPPSFDGVGSIDRGTVSTSGQLVRGLVLNGGTITGTGLTIQGDQNEPGYFTWYSGRLVGEGLLTVGMSATMEISGTGVHDIKDTWTLVNDGSGQILNSFWCDGTASFVNSGELILNYSGSSIGGCTLVNTHTGTIRKVGGSTASIYHLVSDGFVVVDLGTLQPYLTSSFRHVAIQANATFDIWTGEHEIVADGTMTGAGLLSIRGGTLTNEAVIDVETIRMHGPSAGNLATEGVTRVGELLLENGSLLGTGEVYVRRQLTWTAGRMRGGGTTRIAPQATMDINPGGAKDLRETWELMNEGLVVIRAPYWCDANVIVRNVGEMQLEPWSTRLGGCPLRNEASGLIRKTVGGTSELYHLIADGLVRVEAGRLVPYESSSVKQLEVQSGGTYGIGAFSHSIPAGGVVTGEGVLHVSGGTLTNEGSTDIQEIRVDGGDLVAGADVAVRDLYLLGGYIKGSALTEVSRHFSWSAGRMSGSGTLRIGSDANMEILQGGTKELRSGWHFDQKGTGVIQAPFFCDSNVIFENRGELELTYDSGQIFACSLINRPSGVIRKTGTGSSQIHRLDSQGTVEVESGTLVPDRETNIAGRTVIHPDGVLRFGKFGPLSLHESAAVIGTGTVVFGNASSTVNSARFEPGLSPGILNVDGAFHCDLGMVLNIEVGGQEAGTDHDLLAVTGSATICGTLNVISVEGFDPYVEHVYDIVKFASRSGEFAAVNLPEFPGANLSIAYTDTTVELRVGPATGKILVLKDANGDPIADTEFELHRVTGAGPKFEADTLGSFTTDSAGNLVLSSLAGGKYAFPQSGLNPEADTLSAGDAFRITREVYSQSAFKHQGIFDTAWTVHVDNQRMDSDGSTIWFDTLKTEATRDIVLDHSEFRFNLLVGVEWDAEAAYLAQVVEGMRDVSNYMYDVTDGQARLGHVDVFDNDQYGFFDDADVQILATNVYWSDATSNGIQWSFGHVRMPRKDYRAAGQGLANLVTREQSEFGGALTLSAACPEPSEPEGHLQCEDYRVKAHELGHYLFGFGDEYRPLTGGRCRPDPGTEHVYGFMDDQYAVSWQEGSLGYSSIPHSEMSSAAQYSSPDCENTDQFIDNAMSCWDHWESLSDARGEGYYCAAGRHDTRLHPEDVFVPIIRPDERTLSAGSVWVEGPNDYLHAFGRELINYDVGALMTVTNLNTRTKGATTQVTVAENSEPVPGISLHTRPVGVTPPRIEQGLTSAEDPYQGKVFLMGSGPGDEVRAEGRSFTLPDPQVAVEWAWMSGENTLVDPNPLRVDVHPVHGRYPAFSSLVFDVDGNVLHRLDIEQAWPTLPEYELEKLVDPPAAPPRIPYSPVAVAYEAMIGGELPDEGAITVHAVDDALEPFFFSVRYAQDASVSTEARNWIRTPEVGAELMIPATSHSVERVLLSTTAYLPMRAGIGDHAIPVGSVASISTYPPSTHLPSGSTVTIYFTGRDLLVRGGLRGTVESLAMYRWNPDRSDWDLVGGEVNTARLHMMAPATLPGVYALFATALNVGNEGGPATELQVPDRFALRQNYPNPVNPTATISYSLPSAAEVILTVYDVLGRQIKGLVSETKPAGTYEVSFDATGLSSGVYFYRLQAGDFVQTKRMVVVK